VAAHWAQRGAVVRPARLPGKMKTFQAVTNLQFIECPHDDTDFKQGSSFAVVTRGTKRPQTSNGDVGSAINARPALYVALHAAGCHMGGISIEAAWRPRSPWTKTTASSLEPPAVDIQ